MGLDSMRNRLDFDTRELKVFESNKNQKFLAALNLKNFMFFPFLIGNIFSIIFRIYLGFLSLYDTELLTSILLFAYINTSIIISSVSLRRKYNKAKHEF